MLEFILARYNYWIVICLMLTGLYIVISRGNLIKTLIGLNLFQTSVFIFYITMGRIAGGTAPILIKSDKDKSSDHGDAHAHPVSGETAPLSSDVPHNNDLREITMDGASVTYRSGGESLHGTQTIAGAENDLLAAPPAAGGTPSLSGLHETPLADSGVTDVAALSSGAYESGAQAGHAASAYDLGVIYSNPLPHVLILTAIVVGVATTAVGLSLAVRIREAYGTIEEDELEAADYEAEFGTTPDAEAAR